MIEQNNRFPIFINQLTATVFSVFFILLPVIFSNQVMETASLPRHILISSIACVLLFIFSIQLFFNKNTTLHFSKVHLALFVFYCWAFLSLMWSFDPKSSVTELTQLTTYFVIAFFASQLNKNHLKPIINAILVGSTLAATIGILQAFNFNPLELKMSTLLASTFNNKNYAAVYFDLVIPLALITMLTTSSYTKYISSIAYTLILTFILLSKTKGSILGYVVASLLFLFIIYKNKSLQQQLFQKKKIIQYITLSFIIPLSIYSVTAVTLTTTTPISWKTDLTKDSVSVRLSFYKNAYAMFKEDPLTGVGYGAFRKGFVPYASSPNIVTVVTEDRSVAQLHNDPYQNLLELGIVGGGLIILIFSYIFFKSTVILTSIKSINKDGSEYLLIGSFLALVSGVTHSFVDFPLRLPSSAVLFWFITGLTILLINKTSQGTIIKTWPGKIITGVASITICITLLIHSTELYQRLFTASKLQYEATVLMLKNKNNCPTVKEKIDQALNLFFESHTIRHRYAQVYSYCDLSAKVKLAAMNRVLNYDSTDTRARLTRANLLLNKKDFKNARLDYNYLIYVLPHRPAAYLGLGDIATLNKNFKNARKYYEKAKSLEPKNQKANYMLKQFEENEI